MRFRRSRYAYWVQYTLVVVLAFLWMYLRDRGSDALSFFCAMTALVCFVLLEVLIQVKSIVLTPEGVDVHGVRGSVFFAQYGDIVAVEDDSTPFQNALRYGSVRIIAKDNSVRVLGVFEPARLVRAIQRRTHGSS